MKDEIVVGFTLQAPFLAKILVGELLPKMLSANQIAGFFKLLSKTREVSFDFLLSKRYSLKL